MSQPKSMLGASGSTSLTQGSYARTPLIKTISRYLARHCDGCAPMSIRVHAYTRVVVSLVPKNLIFIGL